MAQQLAGTEAAGPGTLRLAEIIRKQLKRACRAAQQMAAAE